MPTIAILLLLLRQKADTHSTVEDSNGVTVQLMPKAVYHRGTVHGRLSR